MSSKVLKAVVVLWLTLAASVALAQSWPAQPVKIIIGFGPGSASDILARLIADELRSTFNQPFIVDNKPGASAQIAAEAVARAAPDGYTLFLTTNTSHSANPYLFKRLPYDPIKDFTPIARVCYFPFVLAVDAKLPIHSVPELLSYAKSNAGKVSYAYGNSTGQVAGAALNHLAHLGATAIPYKSTPQALGDVIGGQVAFMFVDLASSQPHLKSGRLRALAVSTEQPSALAPDLPTVAKTADLPGFDLAAWVAMFGPAGMPADIVSRLSVEINRILGKKEIRDRLLSLGAEVAPSSAAELEAYVKQQLEVWGKKVKDAGIQPE